jgi:hypothetical protein
MWMDQLHVPEHPSFSQLALVPSMSTRHAPPLSHPHVNVVVAPSPPPLFLNSTVFVLVL